MGSLTSNTQGVFECGFDPADSLFIMTPKNHSRELEAKRLRKMYNGEVFNGISGEK